jgi:hypothetical protein
MFYRHDLVGCRGNCGRAPVGVVTRVRGSTTSAAWRAEDRADSDSAGVTDLPSIDLNASGSWSSRRRLLELNASHRKRTARHKVTTEETDVVHERKTVKFDIVTIFPAMFERPLAGVIGGRSNEDAGPGSDLRDSRPIVIASSTMCRMAAGREWY